MNILYDEIKNAIQANMPYIIDANVKVYGEKHRELVEERAKRIVDVIYNNIDGVKDYVFFLECCKQKELAIKFLEKVGVDINEEHKENYAKELDTNINKIVSQYIGFYWAMTPKAKNLKQGIKAWRNTEDDIYGCVKNEKIKFINFLRGENATPITEDTFENFCKTDEYKQILDKIKEYLKAYDEIAQEYEEYLQEIKPYEEYVQEENTRRNDIQTQKRNMIYAQIEDELTDDIKDYLNERYSNIDERSKHFLGKELGEKSYIEYFSKRDEEKLSYISISEKEKDNIYYYRRRYFQDIEVEIDEYSLDDRENCENYIDKGYGKLIPSQELIQKITQLREKAYDELQEEFICNGKDFIENAKEFDNTKENVEAIYERAKNNIICITGGKTNGNFAAILFFTIRSGDYGNLDYILSHEIGHGIESEDIPKKEDYRSGFEFGAVNVPQNPYDDGYRKYERLNETIRDMLAIEATEILHEQGIYILERKELLRDTKDCNTHSICKDLLTNFLDKYREEVVGVLLYGDTKTLYNTIGKENFEELNDIVNRVDYYIQNFGLAYKLANNQVESTIVVEYYKQLERLDQVYANMEKYKSRGETSNDLFKSAISATEETTRLGSIKDAINIISNRFKKILKKDKNEQEHEEIN